MVAPSGKLKEINMQSVIRMLRLFNLCDLGTASTEPAKVSTAKVVLPPRALQAYNTIGFSSRHQPTTSQSAHITSPPPSSSSYFSPQQSAKMVRSLRISLLSMFGGILPCNQINEENLVESAPGTFRVDLTCDYLAHPTTGSCSSHFLLKIYRSHMG